jgi:acyl-CoA synthetase (AMP-forming)/AMP-acid ligase II
MGQALRNRQETAVRKDISGWSTRLTDDMIERYTRDGAWTNRTVADSAIERARDPLQRIAVQEGSRVADFRALLANARRLADALARMGLKPGDVLSFQLPNWVEALSINLAACLGGYICNPIVPIYRDAEVSFILHDARSKVLFIPESFRDFDYIGMARRLRPALPELKEVVVVRGAANEYRAYEDLLATGGMAGARAVVDANAVKLLLYTSGTTGKPKGVLHSHNTLMAEIDAVTRYWDITQDDVILMASPVTHVTGYLYGLELGFVTGAKVVLMERWDAGAAVDLVQQHAVTLSIGATPFLAELVAETARRQEMLPSLRLFGCGGAAVAPELVERATRLLPNCVVCRIFGSSEAPTVTLGVQSRAEQELGATTDGRIVNHEVRIVDASTGTPVADGVEGEIVTRGPELMLGYTDWAETVKAFDDDAYFHTGDCGFLSHTDFITISGRIKDLIIRGGENLSPKDIEDALHLHPAVRDVAVVGMPHERLGETPCAFVELMAGQTLDLAGVTSFLEQARIARQKFPEKIVVVDELPRTASGKIRKQVLRVRAKELGAGER